MRKRDVIFLGVMSFMILALGASIFIFPAKKFSEKENRSLAKAPNLSLNALQSGEYFKKLGDFYSDQFPLRDTFTAMYAVSELSLGKMQVGNIICNGNILVARDKIGNGSDIAEAKIKRLYPEATVYIPPSSAEIFSRSLPKSIRREISSPTHRFPIESYYKTDHHWTTGGAYLAYTEICDMLGIRAFENSYFQKEIASTDFRGTAYARSCLPKWLTKPDTITLYRYAGDDNTEIFCHDSKKTRYGFYELSALAESDKYRVFLDGNYAHLSIRGKEAKPTLLLIKDSFANSAVPFLALHFNIEMVDPRYCSRSYLEEQLARNDIDQTLFLLSADTIAQLY